MYFGEAYRHHTYEYYVSLQDLAVVVDPLFTQSILVQPVFVQSISSNPNLIGLDEMD